MARGRSAGYDDQREKILVHAAQLFAQRGYPATSMNEVAEACGLSKPTLYHYYRDKYDLLVNIAEEHVSQLEQLVSAVERENLPPEPRIRALIAHVMQAYSGAQDAHRVLTEDVRFLRDEDRQRVLDKERSVVAGFSRALAEMQPGIDDTEMTRPLTMLLFGMINWMFTWLKPDGALTYNNMAPVVADLFLGGVPAVRLLHKATGNPAAIGQSGQADTTLSIPSD